MESEKKVIKRWGRPLNYGLVLLLAFVLVVIVLYVSVFNVGLSRAPDNWSAFGSFFGGLIGPGISIVTLLALLRTIDLQLEQSAHFVADGVGARVSEYKAAQLKLLDQQILMYDRLIDRYDAEGERIFKIVRETGVPRTDDLERVDQNIKKAEREITRLVKLSVDISLGEFETVEQLRIKMKHELELINSVLYKV
jgi:hypothetical protein